MVLSPDTLIVYTHSDSSPIDWTPVLSGVAASVIVAGIAWWGTYVQRKVAQDAITSQHEIARKERIVDSRREWQRDLRTAVTEFSKRAAIHFGKTSRGDENPEDLRESIAELTRLATLINLLLDRRKEAHSLVRRPLKAATIWAELGDKLKAQPAPEETLNLAREYGSLEESLKALNEATGDILEGAWEKIRAGS